MKAHQVARRRRRLEASLRRRHVDRHDAERHSVVVFPQPRRTVRAAARSRSADPDGSIDRAIDPERIIGSVVYPAAMLVAPGVVHVVEGTPLHARRARRNDADRAIERISAAFTRAGFKAPVTDDIRGEIWLKIWGNLSFNPISALSHATLVDLLRFPLTRELSIDDDARGGDGREQARRHAPRRHRQADRRRRESRRAQDVDAAGRRGGSSRSRSRRSSARSSSSAVSPRRRRRTSTPCTRARACSAKHCRTSADVSPSLGCEESSRNEGVRAGMSSTIQDLLEAGARRRDCAELAGRRATHLSRAAHARRRRSAAR